MRLHDIKEVNTLDTYQMRNGERVVIMSIEDQTENFGPYPVIGYKLSNPSNILTWRISGHYDNLYKEHQFDLFEVRND